MNLLFIFFGVNFKYVSLFISDFLLLVTSVRPIPWNTFKKTTGMDMYEVLSEMHER